MIQDILLDMKTFHLKYDAIEINTKTKCWLYRAKIYILTIKKDLPSPIYTALIIQKQLADYDFKIGLQFFPPGYSLGADKLLAGFLMGYRTVSPEKIDLFRIHNQKHYRSIYLGKNVKQFDIKPECGLIFTTYDLKTFRTFQRNKLVRAQSYIHKMNEIKLYRRLYKGHNCVLSVIKRKRFHMIFNVSNGIDLRNSMEIGFGLNNITGFKSGKVKYPILYDASRELLICDDQLYIKGQCKRSIQYHKIVFLNDKNLIAYIPEDQSSYRIINLKCLRKQFIQNLEIGNIQQQTKQLDPHIKDEKKLRQKQKTQDQKYKDEQNEQKNRNNQERKIRNEIIGLVTDDDDNVLLWTKNLLVRISKDVVHYIHYRNIQLGIKEILNL